MANGIDATYVSPTKFSVVGNVTDDFHSGRRIKAQLNGTFVYSTISGSAYSAVTTVTIDDAELTSNLTKVWYGAGTGSEGSLPDHAHDGTEGSGGVVSVAGWALVDEINLSNVANTTVSGLNGDSDKRYLVISRFQLAASGVNRKCKIRPNNDSSANYRSVSHYADTTPTDNATSDSSENGLIIGRGAWNEDGHMTAETQIFASSGARRASHSQNVWWDTDTSGRLTQQRNHSYWDNTDDNITSLTFDFDGGTVSGTLEIYKWTTA